MANAIVQLTADGAGHSCECIAGVHEQGLEVDPFPGIGLTGEGARSHPENSEHARTAVLAD